MDFEWDAEKRQSNIRKHGVDFIEAVQIFRDPLRIERLDERAIAQEERWKAIGVTSLGVLLVIYTIRDETYRLISARKATKYERREYRTR